MNRIELRLRKFSAGCSTRLNLEESRQGQVTLPTCVGDSKASPSPPWRPMEYRSALAPTLIDLCVYRNRPITVDESRAEGPIEAPLRVLGHTQVSTKTTIDRGLLGKDLDRGALGARADGRRRV